MQAWGLMPSPAGAGFLLTVAASYLISVLFSDQLGSATILLHLALTAWMLFYWRWGQYRPTQAQLNRMLLLGCAARIILLLMPALTTHDLERYLWDGAVALSGLDPYVITPNDAEVRELRARFPTPEEHAAYPTIYPPLALSLFALCALAGPVWGVWVWKLVITAASIATLYVVTDLLKRTNQTRHVALIALSPLMLLEVGIGAHVDALSALAICAAFWAFVRARWLLVGAALGLGACVKLLPIVALGPFLFATSVSRWPRMIVGALGTIALLYGGTLALGMRPIGNLGVFFAKWRNGSPVNTLLEWGFPTVNHMVFTAPLALLLGCYALYLARQNLLAGLMVMLATPLILSPVVFPWYLLVLVPLFAMRPNIFTLLWLTSAPLAYEVLNLYETTGEWAPANWPLFVIAGGWLVGWLLDRAKVLDPTKVLDHAAHS